MELLDSYLKAVGQGLPEAQREDILRELSEDIRAEMEEKAAELRRPLTKDEQQAVLKRHGNPLLLAARYRQDNRTLSIGRELIGPALFPFYVKVLSFNLGLTFLVITIIFGALFAGGQHVGFQDIMSTALLQLFLQLGAVTLIFSLIQRNLEKFPDRLCVAQPRAGLHFDLKIKDHFPSGDRRKHPAQVSRFDSVAIVVASAVALVWLREVQLHPFLIFGPAAHFLKLGPIWNEAIPLIVVLTCLEMVRATVNFVRPDWTRFHAVARVAIGSASLGIALLLLRAGTWFTLADSAGSQGFARAAHIVNEVFRYGLLVGVLIAAIRLWFSVRHLVRGGQKAAAGSSLNAVC